jgi:hypothetical protein
VIGVPWAAVARWAALAGVLWVVLTLLLWAANEWLDNHSTQDR